MYKKRGGEKEKMSDDERDFFTFDDFCKMYGFRTDLNGIDANDMELILE